MDKINKMDKMSKMDKGRSGQVRREKTPELPSELSFEELRNRFDTSAAVRKEIMSNPSTHGSATRQIVSGKLFKKCKSATFQIDGATYTIVASPPGGAGAAPEPRPPPPRNGSPKQGALTIVRRSSSRSKTESSPPTDEQLDQLDLDTEHLPAVDTPDACDKAALRLRYLLRQLNRGEIPAETLQKNLHYAARVLEAVYIDETKFADDLAIKF